MTWSVSFDSDVPDPPWVRRLVAEFPGVRFEAGGAPAGAAVAVDASAWERGAVDVYEFDARVDRHAERGGARLVVAGGEAVAARVAGWALTRCQRWLDRRNHASSGAHFERVLAAHRRIHDLSRPLVRADHAHALDVWQWTLRLDPGAGAAVQIAALLHDIERLRSEADARVEHRAPSYDAFKEAHARGGARMAGALLAPLDLPDHLTRAVCDLVAHHEQPAAPGADLRGERALLCDADALSFFSLNSPGFLDYFGPAHTRAKVRWTLARMSPRARARMPSLWLRADVAALTREVTRS